MLAPGALLGLSLWAASISLPGGPPVGMDYLAYDAANGRLWVPAGNTGNVDVVDIQTGKVVALKGFPTKPAPRPGRPPMGPSSATVADGQVWVGNRGDNRLCRFDARTLDKGPCLALASMPDGIAWVAPTRELWVTTPRDNTLTIVGTADGKPAVSATIALEGSPEGYAVDALRGIFYTNLEDKDRTLALDVKTRKVVASFTPGCGSDGPRGLALDGPRRLLFVACTSGAVALDLAHAGKVVGRIATGGGVDNIDYHSAGQLLYVASAHDGTLTMVHVGPSGALTVAQKATTARGARNPIVDARGTAYVPDSPDGKLIVVEPPR